MTAFDPLFHNKTAESPAYPAVKIPEDRGRLDQPVVCKPSPELLAQLFDNLEQGDTPGSSSDLLDSVLDTLQGLVRELDLQLFS